MPTAPVGNTFSATLNSNHPLTGVELNDFRFRIEDNSEGRIDLTTANTTLAEVSGTNNWQLDITLTGTLMMPIIRYGCVEALCNTMGVITRQYFWSHLRFAIDSSLDNPDFGSETIGTTKAWSVGTAESLTLTRGNGWNGNDNLFAIAYDPRGCNLYDFDKSVSRQPDGQVYIGDVYLHCHGRRW